MRRLRKSENVRRLVRDVHLSTDDLLYPVFVREGIEGKSEIESMPGQYHYSLQALDELINSCEESQVPGVLIFGVPEEKDEIGSEAFKEDGIVQRAVRKFRENSDLAVFTDVCLCYYTSHGHCGVLGEYGLDNDKTLDVLNQVVVSHAEAGADFVSPSGMMDGQVKSIRDALDDKGYEDVGIMSYSAKFASSFYGPFRDAAESAPEKVPDIPHLGNRETYQMSFKSGDQPVREVALDLEEGADIVMVKPALPYLDVLRRVDEKFDVPLAAYQVSGEYAIAKEGGDSDRLDEKDIFLESLAAMKRSGANFIITYAALDVARWLNEG